MTFKQLIAKYVIGNIPVSEMPELAYVGMSEGHDSPSLHIMAGLDEDDLNSYETEKYFKLAINELGLVIPDTRQAAIEYASALAEQIINHRTDVYTGVGEIINTAIDKYNFSAESEKYLYDSIFFDQVYSLHDTYEDLSVAKFDWIKDKSNKELMLEVKKQLFEALKVWIDRVKSLIV